MNVETIKTSVNIPSSIHTRLRKEGVNFSDCIIKGAEILLETKYEKELRLMEEEIMFPEKLLSTLDEMKQKYRRVQENKEYLEVLVNVKSQELRVPSESLRYYFLTYYRGEATSDEILDTTRKYMEEIKTQINEGSE